MRPTSFSRILSSMCCVLMCGGLPSVALGAVRYVDDSAPGGIGVSWASPHNTLQAALGVATDAVLMQIVPVCPGNVVGDNAVNVSDLLAVINAWGPCVNPSNCPADIAPVGGNDLVNVDDLLAVINAWGACP